MKIGMTFSDVNLAIETKDGVVVNPVITLPNGDCDGFNVLIPHAVIAAADMTAQQIVDIAASKAQFIDVDVDDKDKKVATRILKIGDLPYYLPSNEDRYSVGEALRERVEAGEKVILDVDQAKVIAIMTGARVPLTIRESRAAIASLKAA